MRANFNRQQWRANNLPPLNAGGNAPPAALANVPPNPAANQPAPPRNLRRCSAHADLRAQFNHHGILHLQLTNAVRNNDLAEIFQLGRLYRENNLRCTSAGIAPLLEHAIHNKANWYLKRGLLLLPGVQAADLLPVAVRHKDQKLAEHILGRIGIGRMLDSAVTAGASAQLFNLGRMLKWLKRTRTFDEVGPMLDRAIRENKSSGVKRALCELPGMDPSRLLGVAVRRNDVDLAKQLLHQGADPKRINQATLGNASPQMQELLHAAKTILKLYPRNADGTVPTHGSKLDQALRHFDLNKARWLLELEREEDQFTGIGLWRKDANKRDDIKSALFVFNDRNLFDELAKARGGGRSIMHTGMKGLKERNPALLSFYKKFPYRSEKRGALVNYNAEANFKGTEDPIVCRHLSFRWLLQRITNNYKSDYQLFKDEKAIADNIAPINDELFRNALANADERHLRRNSEWGQFIVQQFRAMDAPPRDGNEKARTQHLYVSSTNHGMAAELKIRYADDGAKSYVVHFYDPNDTLGDKRIAVTDFEDLIGLPLASFLPTERNEETYYGEKEKEQISMIHVLSPDSFAANPVTEDATPKRLTSRIDDLNRTVLFFLLQRGCSDDLRDLQPQIAQHLNSLTSEKQIKFLSALKMEGIPGFFMALQNGYPEAVRLFFRLVLGTNLSNSEKIALLSPRDTGGISGLEVTLYRSHSKTAEAFCDEILKSTLPPEARAEILAGKTSKEVPALNRAFFFQREDMVGQCCDIALNSGLPSPFQVELLSAENPGKIAAFHLGMYQGYAKEVKTFCGRVLKSKLDPKDKVDLLLARSGKGDTALGSALEKNHPDAVEAYCDAIINSNLDLNYKIELLSAADSDGDPALRKGLGSGNVDAAKRFCKCVLRSNLPPSDKVRLLLAENEGVPAWRTQFYEGNDESIDMLCEAVINSDLDDAYKFQLLSAKDRNGVPAFSMALTEGHPDTVATFCDWVFRSKLSDDHKTALLAANPTDGEPTLQQVLKEADCDAETIATFCTRVLNSPLPEKHKCALVSGESEDGYSLLNNALANGRSDIVEKLCRAILQSALPDPAKVTLLRAEAREGMPALYDILADGLTKALEPFCRAVLSSALNNADKVSILRAAHNGWPGLLVALNEGHSEGVRIFCNAVLESGLDDDEKIDLLRALDPNGVPALFHAVDSGQAESIKEFGIALAQSTLSSSDKLKLFAALDDDDHPAMLDATPSADTITAYRETGRLVGIENEPVIQRILQHFASSTVGEVAENAGGNA
jgi:hypothetical protein